MDKVSEVRAQFSIEFNIDLGQLAGTLIRYIYIYIYAILTGLKAWPLVKAFSSLDSEAGDCEDSEAIRSSATEPEPS